MCSRWVLLYAIQKHDFPDHPPRRVWLWHVCGGGMTVLGTAMSIYPFAPTIYLIFAYEGLCKLLLLLFSIALSRNLFDLQRRCALEPDNPKDCDVLAASLLRDNRVLTKALEKQPDLARQIKGLVAEELYEQELQATQS